jgi:protein-S-isoprenylcysteine O-methyltransferase Ste14
MKKMTDYRLGHQIRSLVLPLMVVLVVPLLLVVRTNPFSIQYLDKLPYLQIPVGGLLFGIGLLLLIVTIRLFIRIGKGTLAPWDPTNKLVTEGVYGHVRNPMISGVGIMILGESILLGSWIVLAWFFVVVIANTIYFKLSEEPGLAKRFGNDYRRYRANVPMWIPRLKAWIPNDK